jgi:hypothetical protein
MRTACYRATLSIALSAWLLSSATIAMADPCSPDQQQTIDTAKGVAGESLFFAGQDIGSIRTGGDPSRFEFWFGGEATPDRLDVVENFLSAAYYDALENAQYVCGPSLACLASATAAWVTHCGQIDNRSSHPTVYLCDLYFNNQDFIDVQVGSLVHEYTHLYCSNDIDDYTSASAARENAIEHPDQAIYDAVNLQYYVTDVRP